MEEAKVDCYRSQLCNREEAKLDCYRKRLCGGGCPVIPARPPSQCTRNCCVQVDPIDVKNTIAGVNVDARKKGIEVGSTTARLPHAARRAENAELCNRVKRSMTWPPVYVLHCGGVT